MRSLILNLLASALMAGLVGWILLRGWQELLGLPLPGCLRAAGCAVPGRKRKKHRLSPANWPGWAVFAAPLLLVWAGTLLAYWTQGWTEKTPEAFFRLWLERFTTAGDAPHYLYLAQNGYASSGEKINLIVFYPLYPFLMGLLGRLLGGRYVLAGLLISQTGLGLASLLLRRLACRVCPRPDWALWGFWLYPLGFFSLGIFTEGLFLCLSLGCLCALHSRRWAAAGLWGFFAMLCRVQAMALFPAFVYAAWKSVREGGRKAAPLWSLTIPAGWGVYLLLNRLYTGDFLAFRYYESIRPWWQSTQWVGKTVAQQVDMALSYPWLGKIIYWPQLILYFLGMLLLFAALQRGLPTFLPVYGGGYLGICYLASWLISGGRYMLGCHTLYLALGSLRRREWALLGLLAEFLSGCWFYWQFMGGQSIM